MSSVSQTEGFLHDSDGKESTCNIGDPGLVPGSGRSPGEAVVTHSSILAGRISWTEKPGRLNKVHGVVGLYTTEWLTLPETGKWKLL